MRAQLLGRNLEVSAIEFSDAPMRGVVVDVAGETIALQLESALMTLSGECASHLVATIRHESNGVSDITDGKTVMCGFILVPASRFRSHNPCDVSWWRGGGAAIGDLRLCRV
jgi:hypothetical protein